MPGSMRANRCGGCAVSIAVAGQVVPMHAEQFGDTFDDGAIEGRRAVDDPVGEVAVSTV